ncbi:MAG: DUF2079 domain-containing protein [SAR324 cluster bacterium]|nr:DUF2079 domain-containing protein [SAR324 cluster bacterium]
MLLEKPAFPQFSFFKTSNPAFLFILALGSMEVPVFIGFRPNTGIFALGSLVAFLIFLRLFQRHSFSTVLPVILNQKFCSFLFGWVALGWIVLAVLKYYSLDYYIWDIGIFSNNIINLLESGRYFSSVLGIHGFADHFTPNLILLAPFFKIAPTVLWLAFLKLTAFLVTTWFLYKLGIAVLGKQSVWIYLAPILWLINKYYAFTLRVEFHPSSLAPPFIVAAFYFASLKKFSSMVVCLIILLGFKEHLSLIWLSLGGFLMGEKNYKAAVFCAGTGLAAGFLTYFVIMPAFFEGVGESLHHQSRFAIFEQIPRKFELLGWCLLSVGLIPLVEWKNWLMIIPAFGLTWVTKDPPMLELNYYYYDISITVVVVSVIYAVRKLQFSSVSNPFSPSIMWILRVGLLMCILLVNTYTPQQTVVRRIPTESHRKILEEIRQYREELETGKELWLDDQIGIHFIRFPHLKALPMGTIKSYQSLLDAKEERSVVFLKDPEMSNLATGVHPRLLADLENLVHQGCYRKRSEYKNLLIFEAAGHCIIQK